MNKFIFIFLTVSFATIFSNIIIFLFVINILLNFEFVSFQIILILMILCNKDFFLQSYIIIYIVSISFVTFAILLILSVKDCKKYTKL